MKMMTMMKKMIMMKKMVVMMTMMMKLVKMKIIIFRMFKDLQKNLQQKVSLASITHLSYTTDCGIRI